MLKMIFLDVGNYVFIALFIILIYATIKIVKRISASTLEIKYTSDQKPKYFKNSIIALLIAVILMLGIRGRISLKSPIQWGTAFISDNNFINQLGLNPCFTFLKSYLNSKNPENRQLNFIDDGIALKNISKSLNIKGNLFKSPIARKISASGAPVNANVVIVIMESMGLSKTGLDNNPIQMTPYLDSLAKTSYTFTNVFSAGIHTYNGIYATLFSLPALMNEHPMVAAESTIQPFTGIANTLDQFGYQSVFFCPHDEEFDNMSGFLKNNGFQKIIGQKDFPTNEIVSTMGIPDDLLFEHVVGELNKMATAKTPFLASILTGSDHKPYYIPLDNGFVAKTKDKKFQVVEYADWSINKFLKLSSKQPWYDNTIFVFVADHGSWYRDCYEMNLSYHKIPLLIFSPKLLPQAKMINSVGGQIDVFPTIMGLLNRPYINNTMGVDLLKEGRKFICFSADDKLGCVNDQYFWYNNMGSEWLLHYRDKDPKQYIQQFPLLADTLKNYAYNMLQTTQWLIKNKNVGPQK
ncbi:MAG: LTA synthase family protein [Bacteroidetes bacterium]|nr:LTA synthase family protein [Bacteroidota bacterium]